MAFLLIASNIDLVENIIQRSVALQQVARFDMFLDFKKSVTDLLNFRVD